MSDDIIDALTSYFSEKVEIEDFCGGTNSTMDPYNIWEGIFSSIEKTDFAKWIQTLPKEILKETTKITK